MTTTISPRRPGYDSCKVAALCNEPDGGFSTFAPSCSRMLRLAQSGTRGYLWRRRGQRPACVWTRSRVWRAYRQPVTHPRCATQVSCMGKGMPVRIRPATLVPRPRIQGHCIADRYRYVAWLQPTPPVPRRKRHVQTGGEFHSRRPGCVKDDAAGRGIL